MKISEQTLFFSTSQSCSKILNDERYFNTVKISGQLCFLGQAKVAEKSWMIKNIYSVQWIQGTLCFSGQAQSCSEILKVKKYIQYSENFQGKLCFSEFHFPV